MLPGAVLKYGELSAFSEKIGALLPQRSLLFLLTENNVGGIAWSIGSINSGNVPLILNAHIEEEGFFIICLRFTVLLMCVYHHRWQTHCNMSLCMKYYGYTLLCTGMEPCGVHDDLSHLLPSGSTGDPKLVRHKYENIEAAALNISTFFGLTSADRPLLVLPLYYTMGLSVVFSHLYVGATILITHQT